ncbi:MAG: hypothetical protein ACO31I_09100 [Prochlorotrichaceae cyanobacterium]|jgi:uncharacterized coiled-coil DUF342 family protein
MSDRYSVDPLDKAMTLTSPQRDPIDERIDRIAESAEKSLRESEALRESIQELRNESKDLSTRFNYYQQSTQAIVNLAFSLVASATVAVFVSEILRR